MKATENMWGSTKKRRRWKETFMVMECGCRQCGQGKVEMLENLEEWWQQGEAGPSTSQNMLSIWQNSNFNKKSSRALHLFRLANQMRREDLDVQGEKPVRNDIGELRLDGRAKQAAWKENYERLSNGELGTGVLAPLLQSPVVLGPMCRVIYVETF